METSNSSILSSQNNDILKMNFSWLDYIFFIVTLALSTLIGVYFGCFGSKQKTILEYLMGNRAMEAIPIAVSLVASHISTVTLVVVPAEIYRFGAYFLISGIAKIITSVITIYVYLPVFFNLEITSVHEYMEKRFDRKARLLTSFLYALTTVLHLSVTMYVVALTCSAAMVLSVHLLTPILFCVCILYTSLGGLKGVVWSDALECAIMVGTILVILVLGIKSEGFGQIWKKTLDGKRLDILNFDLDPTIRTSFWSTLIGFTFYYLCVVGVPQSSVQKFLSLPKFRDCVISSICYIILYFVIQVIVILIGLTIYARYSDCDPFVSKSIRKTDQLVPYFIMDVAGNIPGLSGLFVAGVVSAALSTLSASLNCMAGTIYEDFMKLFLKKDIPERKINVYLRIIVVVEGVICMSWVYIIEYLGELMSVSLSFQATTAGPTLGIFTLGLLFPRANSKGAFYGTVIGSFAAAAIVFPSKYYQSKGLIKNMPLPVSTSGCKFSTNQTIYRTPADELTAPTVPYIFKISFFYHIAIGTLVTIITGLIISFLTEKSKNPVNERFLSPATRFLLRRNGTVSEKTRYSSVEGASKRVRGNRE